MFIAMDIGCIECGEDSALVGLFARREDAEAANEIAAAAQRADWHGQHSFQIFEASCPESEELATLRTECLRLREDAAQTKIEEET